MTDPPMTEEELRRMLKPRRSVPLSATRGLQWVMTRRDVAAFLAIVRERFPDIVFLEAENVGERLTKWSRVTDPAAHRGQVYAMVPDRSWDVDQFCAQPAQPRGSGPDKYFQFDGAYGPSTRQTKQGRRFETLNESYLHAGYARSDHETRRFVDQIWRMAKKITTNKVKSVDPETGRTIWPSISGSWCGFDALRWCAAKENRLLNERYRPKDDWVMPNLPWYR